MIDEDGDAVFEGFALSSGQLRRTVDFIVGQDPVKVRRRVAAHRRILERHAPQDEGMGALPPDFVEYGEFGPVCQRCGRPGEYAVAWPCDDLRDLATAYGVDVKEVDRA